MKCCCVVYLTFVGFDKSLLALFGILGIECCLLLIAYRGLVWGIWGFAYVCCFGSLFY